jgi:anti-sigma factor ChrR (cupin superfamily)
MSEEAIVAAGEVALGLRTEADTPRGTEFDAQRAFWTGALAPLGEAAPVAPPSGLMQRIFRQIEKRGAERPGSVTRRSGQRTWKVIGPGVEIATLRFDPVTKERSALLRMAPGAVLESHVHDDDEELFVIEGDLTFGDLELKPGDYHMARRGWKHPPATTRNGCLSFVIMREAA